MSTHSSDRERSFVEVPQTRERDSTVTRRKALQPIDLAFMCKTLRKSTGAEDSVVPALFVTVYATAPRAVLAPKIRDAVHRYIEGIPEDALCSAVIGDDVARLTSRRLASDLAGLETKGARESTTALHYASTPFGSPGGHGLRVAFGDSADGAGETKSSVVRFAFPWSVADEIGADAFLAQALSLVEMLQVDSGTIGLGLDHWHFDRFARDHVNTLLGRFIGLESSSAVASVRMVGRAPSPSFITLLGPALCEALGGTAQIIDQLPSVEAWSEGSTLVLRAAEHPPLGDLDTGARDIGLLPAIAQVLAPVLAEPEPFGGNAVTLDAPSWARRFHAHSPGLFRNRG